MANPIPWQTVQEWVDLLSSAARSKGNKEFLAKERGNARQALSKTLIEELPGLKGTHNLAPNSPFRYFQPVGGGQIVKIPANSKDISKYASAVDAEGKPLYRSLNKTEEEINNLLPHKDVEDAFHAEQVAQTATPKPSAQPWGETPQAPRASVPPSGATASQQAADDAAKLAEKAKLGTTASLIGVPLAGGTIAAGAAGVDPFSTRTWVPPEQRQTTTPTTAQQVSPAVLTAIQALGQQRPAAGLTENDNYPATNTQRAPLMTSVGSQLRGSSNFNPNAMRFSTDKAPIVQAAQQAVQKAAPAATTDQSSGIGNFLSSLFQNKGGEYQSTGERLYRGDTMDKGMQGATKPTGVNWGDPDRASDFFRASKAYQGLQKPQDQEAPAEKRGGRVSKSGEHSAILHKALEIIHHMALKNH